MINPSQTTASDAILSNILLFSGIFVQNGPFEGRDGIQRACGVVGWWMQVNMEKNQQAPWHFLLLDSFLIVCSSLSLMANISFYVKIIHEPLPA